DIDRDEMVLERGPHLGIGPGLLVHGVAPGAPPALQRDDHELLLGRRAREGGSAPLAPEAVLVVDRCRLSRTDTEQQNHEEEAENPCHESHLRAPPFGGPITGKHRIGRKPWPSPSMPSRPLSPPRSATSTSA